MPLTLSIWENAMSIVKGVKNLPKKSSLVASWSFTGRNLPHAGQMYSCKTLPNGNIQKRIVTAYAGSSSSLGMETVVFSPKGELLKAYAGIRDGASGTTRMYASGTKDDVQPVLKNMFCHQFGAKSILGK